MPREQIEHTLAATPLPDEGAAPLAPSRSGRKQLIAALLHPRQTIVPLLKARWALRACDAVGQRPRLFGRVIVRNFGRITIGERLLMYGGTVRCELGARDGGRIEIGNQVFLNYGVSISAHKLVKIGDRCQIGNYSLLMDNDYHQVGETTVLGDSQPIILEDDVWLGARVIVLKGVTIGQGAVIGAGSVVTHNIPARSVAVGVPAKVVKSF